MLGNGQRRHSNEDARSVQDIQAGGAHRWRTTIEAQAKNACSPDVPPAPVPAAPAASKARQATLVHNLILGT
jgi:hypothetical protein